MKAQDILKINPVIAVIAVNEGDDYLSLAKALLDGGVRVLEITLRSNIALKAIEEISKHCTNAVVGAGTITNAKDLQKVKDLGVSFAISPGLNVKFLEEASKIDVNLIPGIASAGELMLGMEYNLNTFKLFPAQAIGGVNLLKSFSGPFKDVKFCPTGGINQNNAKDYLALDNVLCVGGSWICDKKLIQEKNWNEITKLAEQSTKLR
ncbi:bifunctional 4-hydroxy-2-oxoglutarate aldolase/2-dehydro-3-deoxy-phosphogluconate aldolase [Campylobacter canadensis]|uniref:2-dehydro-3-deoxy-phosphogluconate aldolase n=1 Tax=Campylobacter canadensis TaxID=449520 RepID=A0ABS7WQT4_9BACT|nr:bifunctional 4-hydroxy-2-oxoglutarate aldolase/2-dehydro-3-deoxy-phosphogluconate aldolase [Campylobacter canadensis]MBZ7987123.1 bifunctional 4-hydroxy-2-oxoglutarate aldolase/2-dehydro-3-deoxy-phosphogluconate aldolase [Campylobacter canadensis]MBZ7994523.1 bifunctional 4-hydroxy-2-oxoglutarate aldolase/2-dehydro-3-deoxy-phosphogluconate aldolase [Campylobacter canadensis]MBZ7997210.1 bifunctional 4-hydroxy-2-oxoglutarate aldolase/2-dehydro-3-deoxy-phosphogluconate aldolase [Campylobacter c